MSRRVPHIEPASAVQMIALVDHAIDADAGDPFAYLRGYLAARSVDAGPPPDPRSDGAVVVGRVEITRPR